VWNNEEREKTGMDTLRVEEHVKTEGFHNPAEMNPQDLKVVDGPENVSIHIALTFYLDFKNRILDYKVSLNTMEEQVSKSRIYLGI
jgi:hypothetical protein